MEENSDREDHAIINLQQVNNCAFVSSSSNSEILR
jgi:hypothetical protein